MMCLLFSDGFSSAASNRNSGITGFTTALIIERDSYLNLTVR